MQGLLDDDYRYPISTPDLLLEGMIFDSPRRMCESLPEPSKVSASWFQPGELLRQAEGVARTVCAAIRSRRNNPGPDGPLTTADVLKALDEMSDRRFDELVAEVTVLPTTANAANTSRGISDALRACKKAMSTAQEDATVVGDQAVYARLLQAMRDKPEFSWMNAYPGMSLLTDLQRVVSLGAPVRSTDAES